MNKELINMLEHQQDLYHLIAAFNDNDNLSTSQNDEQTLEAKTEETEANTTRPKKKKFTIKKKIGNMFNWITKSTTQSRSKQLHPLSCEGRTAVEPEEPEEDPEVEEPMGDTATSPDKSFLAKSPTRTSPT